MEGIDLIQIITGQSPAMALSIILLIFYNKQNAEMVRREKEVAEILLRERKEERDSSREMRIQQIELLQTVVRTLTEMKAEIQAVSNQVRQIQTYTIEEDKRKRGT